MTEERRDDRLLPETRWVSALIIPFLVIAFFILYFTPGSTGERFAWKIDAPMSAMMLGAAYAGGIYYFTGLLLSKQWHRVMLGLPPVITFAAVLGIATLLHWDRFRHGSLPFAAWSTLYFTAPVVIFWLWLRNRSRDPGTPEPGEVLIARPIRLAAAAAGIVILVVAVLLFLRPEVMMAVWPWNLTPLTARVMSAMFSLAGVVGLGIASEPRWSAARLLLQSQGFSLLLILIAAGRDWADFRHDSPAAVLFAGGLGGMLLGIVILFVLVEGGGTFRRGSATA